MDSSEEQLPHGNTLCNLDSVSYEEMDPNGLLKSSQEVLTQPQATMYPELRILVAQLLKRIERLEGRLDALEAKQVHTVPRRKKNRRRAREIPRTFQCPDPNCRKEYGSQTSLKNHRRIKHGIRMIRTLKSARGEGSPPANGNS